MFQLRWLVKPGTTTEAPKLQYRSIDDRLGGLPPGPWVDVPVVVEEESSKTPPAPIPDFGGDFSELKLNYSWVCTKCKADRLKEPCKALDINNCEMKVIGFWKP